MRRRTIETAFGRAHFTAKGHLRVHSRGPNRDKYVHRLIADRLCREFCVYGAGLPDWLHVHHVNFKKDHNCACNFILLDEALHNGTNTQYQPRGESGRYARQTGTCGQEHMGMQVHVQVTVGPTDMPDWIMEDF
jgi:hypothetical protein